MQNRARLVAAMRAKGAEASEVVLLKGGEAETRHDTDHEMLFRQESYFQWAFGVREPDCFGVIHLATGEATLLIPRLPVDVAPWVGAIEPPESFAERYAVSPPDLSTVPMAQMVL
jgi:Xaa-Pro dipeptidase